jgi:hypothetical protein
VSDYVPGIDAILEEVTLRAFRIESVVLEDLKDPVQVILVF